MQRQRGSPMAGLHRRLGDLLLLLGSPGGAAWAYADALRVFPDCARTHLARGDALSRACRWLEASVDYREAARLQPSSLEAHGSLVQALARGRRPAECLAAIDGLIRVRPFDAEPHLLRGALLSRLGRHTHAVQTFRWAAQLKVGPDDRRFLLGEEVLGARSWTSLLAHHRSAQALVRSVRKHVDGPEGQSILNSPPQRKRNAHPRSGHGRARSRPRAARLRATARFARNVLARTAAALSASLRPTRRAVWMALAAFVARRHPHLALRWLRAVVTPVADERTARGASHPRRPDWRTAPQPNRAPS